MIDEDLRREQRLALSGAPLSLRRLTELERFATAIAEYGRRQPPIALFQLPEGTTNTDAVLRSLRYTLRAQWEWNGPVEPDSFLDRVLRAGAMSAQAEHFTFRQRGLMRFKPDEPLRPTFEIRPSDSLPERHILRVLWLVGAEVEITGVFVPEAPAPASGMINVAYLQTHVYVSDFYGPVILTFTIPDRPRPDAIPIACEESP